MLNRFGITSEIIHLLKKKERPIFMLDAQIHLNILFYGQVKFARPNC